MSAIQLQIEFTGISRVLTGRDELTLSIPGGSSVEQVITSLGDRFPELVGQIIYPNGKDLIPTNLFSLNGEKILRENDKTYSPKQGDKLILLSILSGG